MLSASASVSRATATQMCCVHPSNRGKLTLLECNPSVALATTAARPLQRTVYARSNGAKLHVQPPTTAAANQWRESDTKLHQLTAATDNAHVHHHPKPAKKSATMPPPDASTLTKCPAYAIPTTRNALRAHPALGRRDPPHTSDRDTTNNTPASLHTHQQQGHPDHNGDTDTMPTPLKDQASPYEPPASLAARASA